MLLNTRQQHCYSEELNYWMDYLSFTSALGTWASSRLAPVLIIGITVLATSSLAFEGIPYVTLCAIYLLSYIAGCLLTQIPVRIISSIMFRIFMATTGLKFLVTFLTWMGSDYFNPVKIKTMCVLMVCCVALYFIKLKSYVCNLPD